MKPIVKTRQSVGDASLRIVLLPGMMPLLLLLAFPLSCLAKWLPASGPAMPWLGLLLVNASWFCGVTLPIGRAKAGSTAGQVGQGLLLCICASWQGLFSLLYLAFLLDDGSSTSEFWRF